MAESLADIFAAEERKRLAETRAEIAAEPPLTDDQKQAMTEAYEAKWASLDDLDGDDEEE